MIQDHEGLFNRFLKRECSSEEAEQLLHYFRTEEGDAELVKLIESRLAEENGGAELTPADHAVISAIGGKILQTNSVPSYYTKLRKWLPYAAALLLVSLGLSLFLFDWYFPGRLFGDQPIDLASQDIFSGGNQATLKLSDGRTITLDTAQSSIIVGSDNITYGDGEVPVLAENELRNASLLDTLTLTTAGGGTYQVILPDGSKIWLNAKTTLKYPARFAENQRVVYLEGEAFFEIATRFADRSARSEKIPFKVISNGQEVEVLGTKFNISAYHNSKQIRTTLTEGKVRVSIDNSVNTPNPTTKGITLSPGQQAVANSQTIHVRNVDTEPYTAWKDGFFYFDDAMPQIALAELARWYDLDVDYEGKIPEVRIFGIIDRNKPLSAVLKSLEKSGLSVKLVRSGDRNKLIILGEKK